MKLAALFSGGKDSTYAIYLAQQRGWDVKVLLSMLPKAGDSYMFHVPNIQLAPMLAEAMGIECLTWETAGKKEKELEDLKNALATIEIDGVLTGAIASDYQATRIDRVCFSLGLTSFSPLWRWDQHMVLDDIIHAGFKIMVVGVYAEGLGRDWLGRILEDEAIAELQTIAEKHGINVCGEGGELETLVLDGPNFEKSLEVLGSEINWNGHSGEMHIRKAELVEK